MAKKTAALLINIITAFYSFSQSNPNLVDQPLLYGTLQIKYNNGTASAFQYKGIDSIGYLVTAKHVFAKKYKRTIKIDKVVKSIYFDSIPNKDGDKLDIQIYYAGVWKNLPVKVFLDNDSSDVAILETNIPMAGNNYKFGDENLRLSQECFFLGYPLGLHQDFSKLKGFGPYPLPFVRKGIISAFDNIKEGLITRFFIDGHNTYGFSGGPLIFYNYVEKSFFVAGVISGYIPQRNHSYRDDGTDKITEENSGLMLVYNIEFAKKILKRLKAM